MYGVVDPVIEVASPGDATLGLVNRGEIYEDKPLYLPARHSIRFNSVEPNGYRAEYEIVGGRPDGVFRHPPLKSAVALLDGEALAVARSKNRRPVIVLSQTTGQELSAGAGDAKSTEAVLCAPVYGADQFPAELIERVRDYEFPNLFYIPSCTTPHFDEGFVRLDHLQSISVDYLKARRGKLSEGAMAFLDEWLGAYLTGSLPDPSLIGMYLEERT